MDELADKIEEVNTKKLTYKLEVSGRLSNPLNIPLWTSIKHPKMSLRKIVSDLFLSFWVVLIFSNKECQKWSYNSTI